MAPPDGVKEGGGSIFYSRPLFLVSIQFFFSSHRSRIEYTFCLLGGDGSSPPKTTRLHTRIGRVGQRFMIGIQGV